MAGNSDAGGGDKLNFFFMWPNASILKGQIKVWQVTAILILTQNLNIIQIFTLELIYTFIKYQTLDIEFLVI